MIEVKGDRLHRGQRLLEKEFLAHPEIKNWVVTTPRQWGKTTYLLNKALQFAMNTASANVWYVTPFYKIAIEIFDKKLKPMIGRADGKAILDISRTYRQIITGNKAGGQSFLKFESSDNYNGLRSASLTHLICDEFAYFRPEAYEVLAPMLARRGKFAIFVSTPFGKNQFHDFWQRGTPDSPMYQPGWGTFRGTAEMTGDQNYLNYIEAQRALHAPDIFRQEYEAAFVDSSGAVFKNLEKIRDTAPERPEFTSKNFVGVDLGQSNDRTVIVALNERGEIVRLKRFDLHEQQNSVILCEILADEISQIPGAKTWIEKNFNPAVISMIHARGALLKKNVRPWTTTNKNKRKAISDLIAAIDSGAIKAPPGIDKNLYIELQNFNYKMSGQTLAYGAPPGGHDDIVMALAIAYQNLLAYKGAAKKTYTL